MKKNQFCREVNSPWTRRLLHSVPIALSLFVAISSAAEAMAANVTEVSASQQVTEDQRKNLRDSYITHKF